MTPRIQREMQTTAVFAWEGNEADAPFPLRHRLDVLESPKCFKNSQPPAAPGRNAQNVPRIQRECRGVFQM